MPLYDGIAWPTPVGGKAPKPCPVKRCGLVYTPGFYRAHVRDYHRTGEAEPKRTRRVRVKGESGLFTHEQAVILRQKKLDSR